MQPDFCARNILKACCHFNEIQHSKAIKDSQAFGIKQVDNSKTFQLKKLMKLMSWAFTLRRSKFIEGVSDVWGLFKRKGAIKSMNEKMMVCTIWIIINITRTISVNLLIQWWFRVMGWKINFLQGFYNFLCFQVFARFLPLSAFPRHSERLKNSKL